MWTCLKSWTEWESYCEKVVTELRLTGSAVNFGSGPKSFPALVCSLQTGPNKLASAYVYVGDAESLLKAAGKSKPAEVSDARATPRTDYDRWFTANLFTVAHFLRATGICKDRQYEEQLAKEIQRVDRFSAEDRLSALSGEPWNAEAASAALQHPDAGYAE